MKKLKLKLNFTRFKNIKLPKNISFMLAFLIPIFIMIGIYIGRGIYPFGKECFLRTDMYHQYAPFFAEFYNKIKNGGSLLYSWNIGVGVNFTALYAYYLASPLNWLIYLSPQEYIIEFMSILIILKIALSSLTFSIYLSKHFNTKHMGIIVFSIFYALSSYIAAYSWNIMWLDCMVLLPIIVLGLERLVKENKCLLYSISLGLAILSNYYISIMICIFLVFYFFILIFTLNTVEEKKHYFKKFINFGVFSLLAGGCAAFLILPEFFALQLTSSGDISFPENLSTYFSVFDVASRHLMNIETSVLSGNYPNVYCGLPVLILFPLYIISKAINTKEKILKILLLFVFIISFNMNIPNFIWHGFHFPNSLPCRQSFIYIFLILTMSYEAFREIKYYSDKQICGVFCGVVAFIFLIEKLLVEYNFSIIYLSLLFVGVYMLIAYFYRIQRFRSAIIVFFLIFISISEVTINTNATSVSTTNRKNYTMDREPIKELTDKIMQDDTDFYRIEKLYRRTKNDTAWHNIRGVSLFSSTASEPLTKLLDSLGFMNSTNAYSYEGATPLTSAIFSVKYLLTKKHIEDNDLLKFQDATGEISLYKNNYALPLGFMVNKELKEMPNYTKNPFVVQNEFIDRAVNGEAIFDSINNTTNNDIITIHNDKTQHVYIYIQSQNIEKIRVDYDGLSTEYELDKKQQIVDLGICEAGKTIDIKNSDDKELKISSYSFDESKFKTVYEKLNTNPLKISHFDDTNIKGVVNADRDGLLFTSIPYDKGWNIKVDSIEVEPLDFKNALIMVDIPQGEHTIEFNYIPEGFELGKIISISSVILLIIIITLKYKFK